MKHLKLLTALLLLTFTFSACSTTPLPAATTSAAPDAVEISLSDDAITVDGTTAVSDAGKAVYIDHDIVYYESGRDFTYGEGTEADAHSAADAAAHTVVHITQPGTYRLQGSLTKGQIAVDLGDEAASDPKAIVTLILNGVDISCEVAPAVIFYNVYECGSADTATASKDVDTSGAGANVIIADGTNNTVRGSYVARIYKPDSVVLNDAGTEVEDAKKLHKYDAAFYSKMSMNINGERKNSGVLTIDAENEGLDSELHLTVNGGIIRISSGNDGINTNEDGVSVTTINGGALHIKVTGETGEGDGIDSNGWLVINGGIVTAEACSTSADAGIDSDMGIHINGGTVIATGHMLDRIEDGGQTYAVFSFAQTQTASDSLYLQNGSGERIMETTPQNDFSILIYSSPTLTPGNYTLWRGDTQLAGQSGGMMGGHGMHGMSPNGGGAFGGMEPAEGMTPPEGFERPEGMEPPEGFERPEGMEPPEDFEHPEGMEPPEGFEPGSRPDMPQGDWNRGDGAASQEFQITAGGNMFQNIS